VQWNGGGTPRVRRGDPAAGRSAAKHQQVPQAGRPRSRRPDQGARFLTWRYSTTKYFIATGCECMVADGLFD
jgi:hypothetical protein